MSNEEQGNANPEPSDTSAETADAVELRVDRILEQIDDSLRQENALEAVVGAAGGDLMLIKYRMSQAIDEALRNTPDVLSTIAEIMPSLNVYTKLGQQVGQFVQLSLKLKSANSVN